MKQRLDIALVERGLADTRAKAQALIMAGEVMVDGQRVDKAGVQVADTALVEVKAVLPYVSRGGLKLAHALDVFGLKDRVAGDVALDIGASTGGFTDVLLQAGAARVYAVDVGTNQLAWKLRTDPRVIVLEQTNIRDLQSLLSPEDATEDARPMTPPGVATADVSFIGLELITPAAIRLTRPGAFFVFLVKPQFEAGRELVGKGGVVRDLHVHRDVIIRLAESWQKMGLLFMGLTRSPITGPAGNIEYLVYLERAADNIDTHSIDLKSAINNEVFGHDQ